MVKHCQKLNTCSLRMNLDTYAKTNQANQFSVSKLVEYMNRNSCYNGGVSCDLAKEKKF